jgi:spermidine/putrescine-binding protein
MRLQMTVSFHRTAALLAAAALACCLAGCASINEKLASGMGDYLPQWAGGMPADAPPRPGTAKYDEFMKERERKRQQPAAGDDADKTTSSMVQSAPAR